MVQRRNAPGPIPWERDVADYACKRHNRDRRSTQEVMKVSRQTTGIIALVSGIIVLIWPSWTYVVLGILLIALGVAMLTGRMKSLF